MFYCLQIIKLIVKHFFIVFKILSFTILQNIIYKYLSTVLFNFIQRIVFDIVV